ncbi:hypothetical protein ACFX5K_03780 [Rickettsiales bacterium LUAb2]
MFNKDKLNRALDEYNKILNTTITELLDKVLLTKDSTFYEGEKEILDNLIQQLKSVREYMEVRNQYLLKKEKMEDWFKAFVHYYDWE